MKKGLLSAANETGAAQGVAAGQGEGNAASPEEEQLMEQALNEAGNILYVSDQASESVLEGIAGSPNPAQVIGETVSQVIEVVDKKMDLPDDFIIPMVEPVSMMIIEMADTAGLIETSDEVVEEVFTHASALLAQTYQVDIEDARQYSNDPDIAGALPQVGGVYAKQS